MRLGIIALRLRSFDTRFQTKIYGAAELAIALESTFNKEAGDMAFVIPVSEEIEKSNDHDTAVIQRVKETFGIVCAIKNDLITTDKLGITAFDLLHDIRSSLCTALIGWPMTDAEELTSYAGAKVVDINQAYLWYQYNFTTAYMIITGDTISSSLDDFKRVYTEWFHDDNSRRVLPLVGDAPLLPNEIQVPDFKTLIDYKYSHDDGFSTGYNTLKSEFRKIYKKPEE